MYRRVHVDCQIDVDFLIQLYAWIIAIGRCEGEGVGRNFSRGAPGESKGGLSVVYQMPWGEGVGSIFYGFNV